jgi:hypothetical protein
MKRKNLNVLLEREIHAKPHRPVDFAGPMVPPLMKVAGVVMER